MGKFITPVLYQTLHPKHGIILLHWCSGCNKPHGILITKRNSAGEMWRYNNKHESPSIEPGISFGKTCQYLLLDGAQVFIKGTSSPQAGKIVDLRPFPKDFDMEAFLSNELDTAFGRFLKSNEHLGDKTIYTSLITGQPMKPNGFGRGNSFGF